MNSRDRNIIRNSDIDVLFATKGYFVFLCKANKMENFTFSCPGDLLFHKFHNDVRFGRFRNIDCVKLFAVHIYPISERFHAHLAAEWLPIDGDTVLGFGIVQPFGQPAFEAV